MSKTIIQKSLEPGVFQQNPNLTAFVRSEIPGPGNTGSDQVCTLQSIIDQSNQNGTITAIITFNDRQDYDPDATDYEQRDLVQYEGAAYFRKTNNPPLLVGSNLGGELPSKTSTQWAFLAESGAGLVSARIALAGEVSLLLTHQDVIKWVPTASGHKVNVPDPPDNTYKQFTFFNFDPASSITLAFTDPASGPDIETQFGGTTGYTRVEGRWVQDEWVIFRKIV